MPTWPVNDNLRCNEDLPTDSTTANFVHRCAVEQEVVEAVPLQHQAVLSAGRTERTGQTRHAITDAPTFPMIQEALGFVCDTDNACWPFPRASKKEIELAMPRIHDAQKVMQPRGKHHTLAARHGPKVPQPDLNRQHVEFVIHQTGVPPSAHVFNFRLFPFFIFPSFILPNFASSYQFYHVLRCFLMRFPCFCVLTCCLGFSSCFQMFHLLSFSLAQQIDSGAKFARRVVNRFLIMCVTIADMLCCSFHLLQSNDSTHELPWQGTRTQHPPHPKARWCQIESVCIPCQSHSSVPLRLHPETAHSFSLSVTLLPCSQSTNELSLSDLTTFLSNNMWKRPNLIPSMRVA